MSENRLKRKRQSDRKKQKMKAAKQIEKNAQESWRGHQNGQYMAKGKRKRTRKDISKRRIFIEEQREKEIPRRSRKQTEKRSSTKGTKLQRIRERREGKSCVIWVFSNAKAQKIKTFFTNRRLILASVYN